MTPSGSATDAVVHLGEWDESADGRGRIVRVVAPDPESSVHVQKDTDRVGFMDFPVDPDRGSEYKSPAGALIRRSTGSDEPGSGPYDRFCGCCSEVPLEHRGEADVLEAPGAKREIETGGVPEQLDVERDRAAPSDGYPEPHPVADVRARRLSQYRGGHEGQRERQCGSGSLQSKSAEWSSGDGAETPVFRSRRGRRIIGTVRRRVHGGRVALFAGSVGMVALAAGCAAPDAPDALELTLPETAMALLVPDSVRTVELHSGVTYRYLWSPEGPWAIHVVQADMRARCDLELEVLRPDARQRGGNGHATVSDMVLGVSDRVLVAVNADFFTPEGTTLGAEVVSGDVQYAAERPTVAWQLGLDPWIGLASIDAAGLHLGWLVGAVEGDGVTEAVGGFPDLIDRGEIVGDLEVGRRPAFAAVRHPRTGVGLDSRSGQFWIVVVDGRQMPHSAGMSLPEFAALFDALGADEALNLDGGGSSAMVVGRGLVNRPSDATGERAVVNALALTQNPRGCAAGQARP